MALELPNSIFFHLGRTAGHWVRFVIQQAGIPGIEIGGFHDWPSCISLDERQAGKTKFCIVRHPLDWLRSYWMHEMQFGWSINSFSEHLVSDNFAEFLRRAITHHQSGPVTIAYAPFVDQCDEIGRQEELASALCGILTRAGEEFDPKVLSGTGSVSVEIDPEIRRHAVAPESLLREVLAREETLCARWGYSGVPPHLIGDETICISPYVRVGDPDRPCPDISKEVLLDLENSFGLGDHRVSGINETRRTTLLIRRFLDTLDLKGKSVIDTSATDGVFCFYAEARGAARTVGIRQGGNLIADDYLAPLLGSRVEFVSTGFYGIDSLGSDRFDVALCFRLLEKLRYPMLAIRCLSRVLNPGGTLVLECGVLDFDTRTPLLAIPVGSESPNTSNECSFFNFPGLRNALAAFGFHDFKQHYAFTHGIDAARDFSKWGLSPGRAVHSSESTVGRILLSCTFAPALADEDPRYLADGISGSRLRNAWDSQLPQAVFATGGPAQDSGFDLRAELRRQECKLATALGEVRELRAAVLEREVSIAQTIAQREDFERDLIERTTELEQVRQDVLDRTRELEQARQDVLDRTRELIDVRRDLVDRTVDLVATRETLVVRTEQLEATAKERDERTAELVELRETLHDRTLRLETTAAELQGLRNTRAWAPGVGDQATVSSDNGKRRPE